jgi:hypothetical protein
MHELIQKKQVLQKRKNQEDYRDELTKLSGMKMANAQCDKQNVDMERGKLRNQWDLQNRLQNHLKTEETKNLRSMLNSSYAQQIDMHNQAKMSEEEAKRNNDRMLIDKNLKMMNLERKQQKDKRQEYAMARIEDLRMKIQKKEYETDIQQKNVEESKKLMDEYSMNEIQKEQQYRDKFSSINNHMKRNLDKYVDNVMTHDRKRQLSEDVRQTSNIHEYNQKKEHDHMYKLGLQQSQQLDMNKTLSTQVHENANSKMLTTQLFNIESQMVKQKQNQIQTMEDTMKSDKKKRQQDYKDLLASQIDFNSKVKLQGNMSKAEKDFNRIDLKAYKSYDHNVYSMIPGISNIPEGRASNPTKIDSRQTERLDKTGYGRLENNGYNGGLAGLSPVRNKNNNSISVLPGHDDFNAIANYDNKTYNVSTPNRNRLNRGNINLNINPYLDSHSRRKTFMLLFIDIGPSTFKGRRVPGNALNKTSPIC